MQKIRILGAGVALGGVALLSGCVGVPGDPYYSGGGYATGGYSSGPYYSEPAPVYVAPAPVYINGGSYYQRDRRPYYDGGRPYYGRPGYPAVRPVRRPRGPRATAGAAAVLVVWAPCRVVLRLLVAAGQAPFRSRRAAPRGS
jgi:hypothetical protein